MSQDVKNIFIQGVSNKQKLKQSLEKNAIINCLTAKKEQNQLNQPQPEQLRVQQMKNTLVENFLHKKDYQISTPQQKQNIQLVKNLSLEQLNKKNSLSIGLSGNSSQDQLQSQKVMSLKQKVQSQIQQQLKQPNSSNFNTQNHFSKKSASQFEINLSQLNTPLVQPVANQQTNSQNNLIDFSRFKKKEIGQKVLSQSQLLFDQLKRKNQEANMLCISNEIGRKEEQLIRKRDVYPNQNLNIQSERQHEGSGQSLFSLSSLYQKTEEQSPFTDVKQLQKTHSKFFQSEQDLSPYKKINGILNQKNFRYSFANDLSVRNNSQSSQMNTNNDNRNSTQMDLSHKRVIQNLFPQQRCQTQNDSQFNNFQQQQKQENLNFVYNQQVLHSQYQSQSSYDHQRQQQQSSKEEKIRSGKQQNFQNLNNQQLNQYMQSKSQQDIQICKFENKRSGSINQFQDDQSSQLEKDELNLFSIKKQSINQSKQRLKTEVEIIIPQNQYRNIIQNSLQKNMNLTQNMSLNNNNNSNNIINNSSAFYQRNWVEQSPIIQNKTKNSQFRQKSQTLLPQISQDSDQQQQNNQQSLLPKLQEKYQTNIIATQRKRIKPCEFSKSISSNIQNIQSLNLEREDSQRREEQDRNNLKTQTSLEQSYKQPQIKQQINEFSEDEYFSICNAKNNSFFLPSENGQKTNIKIINSIRHTHSKSKFEKSQMLIDQLDISPINKQEGQGLNFNLVIMQQQSSLRNHKQQDQSEIISTDNATSSNSLQKKQVDSKNNKIEIEGRQDNEQKINLNKTKISALNLNLAKKIFNNQSFHSQSDFSPSYSSKGQAQGAYTNQQLLVQEKIKINWFIYNQIIDFFSYQKLKKYNSELQNIQFRSQTFYDFIKNIIFIDIEENISGSQKQKGNKKDQNLKFCYMKEHIKLIGITPNLIPLIAEEIKEKLKELVKQSQDDKSQLQISEQNITQIQENFNYYLKQNIHWTLLDEFGTEQDLLNFSKQLYQSFLFDPLCLKCLNILQIDDNNFNQIILSAFQKDYLEENLKEEIQKRMTSYLNSQSTSQNSSISSFDLTYADFFYIKYKFMYFCLEKGVNLKMIFAILETIEKLRFLILKKPQTIESFNYDTIGFQLRSKLQSHSTFNQIVTENNFSFTKLESILGNLVKSIVTKSISFYPLPSLPQQINVFFSQDQEFTVFLCNQILLLLQRDYKCEKNIILDAQLALSTIKIASGVKQSIINQILSNQNMKFEILLNKLLNLLDENQIFNQYTSLSNPINLKLFIINLLCFLFDIFIDDQPCRIYSLDLKAQFKMFGCNFVAYNDFLIQVQNFLRQYISKENLQDFILNSCKDLKGLDIFD